MYSNSCCSLFFEGETIKIGQSSHKMYSNNILNFQESTTNACTKKVWKLIEGSAYEIELESWTVVRRHVDHVKKRIGPDSNRVLELERTNTHYKNKSRDKDEMVTLTPSRKYAS